MLTARPAGPALLLTVALLALSPLRPAAAQAPAVGFTPGAAGFEDTAGHVLGAGGSYSLGFEFTANGPLFVTSLGYFNDPRFDAGNPFNDVDLSLPSTAGSHTLSQTHQVGLYQIFAGVPGASLIAQATVSSSSTPDGYFLYTALGAPVTLVTGGDYVLAGVSGSNDPYLFSVGDTGQPGGVGLTTNGITYVQDRYDVSSSLTLPTQTDAGSPSPSTPGFFGPNMKVSPPSAAPEPSEWAVMGLIALGTGGLLLRARRWQSGAVAG